MTINAGTLNRRVTIQQLQPGVDELGQPIQAWGDVATVFASIKSPTGSSTIYGEADVAINKMAVRIRYRDGLTAGMQLVHKGKAMMIEAILPDMTGGIYTDILVELKS